MRHDAIKRVLMVGTHIGLADEADSFLERALRACSIDLRVFDILASDFAPLALRRLIPKGIKQRLSPRQLPGVDSANDRLRNQRLMRVIDKFHPDLVIALRAERLDAQSLRYARAKGALLINWTADIPESFVPEAIVPLYDLWLIFDRSHQDWFVARGARRVEYLPLACDPASHHPVMLTQRERAKWNSRLCFVGAHTPRREYFFESVADLGLAIWGPRWEQAKSQAVKSCVRSVSYLDRIGCLRAYSAADIVLSVQSQTQQGLSNRVWEVLAAGSCLIAEATPAFDEELVQAVSTFHNPEELRKISQQLLADPPRRLTLAEKGRRLVLSEHTYLQRARKILEWASECRTQPV